MFLGSDSVVATPAEANRAMLTSQTLNHLKKTKKQKTKMNHQGTATTITSSIKYVIKKNIYIK